jgi:hypothetical protein
VCSAQDTGQGVCQPATTLCGDDGEMCSGDPDCCAGETCVAEPAPSTAHRCRAASGDAACRSDGTACALPAECCGGHCVPGASGPLSCASSCTADGAECTFEGDCCAAGSACQAVVGSLVCAPRAP